jgi:3'-5' exoribonuclease 1
LNYIVLDVEATCWEGRPPNKTQEIIEIGAFRLNDYGEVMDRFSRFVRPVIHPHLSLFCQQLTSIRQEDVDRAEDFAAVIEAFMDWGEIYDDEEYLLCSWGNFDKRMLMQDCTLHRLDPEWAERHINLKQQYKEIKRLNRPRGLKSAVLAEGFEFTGAQHRGVYDAENLAKIFVKYLDEWRW